jgi:tetratricopeptide (TPR) repeat protein
MGAASRLALALLVATSAAAADEGKAESAAREHSAIGTGLYRAGRYEEALREFSLGYALAPRPGFLFNMARSHFRLGQFTRARALFQQFLDVTADTPDPAQRTEAGENIALIDREHPDSKQAPAPAEKPPPAPVVEKPGPAPAAPVEKPAPRRRWVWPLVGGAIAVAAAVVAVVLAVTLSVDYGAREQASCTPPGCLLFGGLQ